MIPPTQVNGALQTTEREGSNLNQAVLDTMYSK